MSLSFVFSFSIDRNEGNCLVYPLKELEQIHTTINFLHLQLFVTFIKSFENSYKMKISFFIQKPACV